MYRLFFAVSATMFAAGSHSAPAQCCGQPSSPRQEIGSYLPEELQRPLFNARFFNNGISSTHIKDLCKRFEKYFPDVRIEYVESKEEVNAVAFTDLDGNRRVELWGGMGKHPAMRLEGLAIILAHEVGHHYGNTDSVETNPTDDSKDRTYPHGAYCEDQSDFWATRVGLRIVYNELAPFTNTHADDGGYDWKSVDAADSDDFDNDVQDGIDQAFALLSRGLFVTGQAYLNPQASRARAASSGCGHPRAGCRKALYESGKDKKPRATCNDTMEAFAARTLPQTNEQYLFEKYGVRVNHDYEKGQLLPSGRSEINWKLIDEKADSPVSRLIHLSDAFADDASAQGELFDRMFELQIGNFDGRNLTVESGVRASLTRRTRKIARLSNNPVYQANRRKLFEKYQNAGRDEQSRILGGRDTNEGEFPHCVAVGSSNRFCCTGTLVAPRVVITAGHCFDGGCRDRIYIGVDWHDARIPTETANIYSVAQAYIHPDYDPFTLENDIAVLILDKDVNGVEPCPIAEGSDLANAFSLRLAGFGLDENGESGIQRTVDVPIATVNCDCSITDPASGREYSCSSVYGCFPGKEIVAGGGGTDTCNGDSGGPAYVVMGDGSLRLGGITSRATSNRTVNCGDGGIYVRADVFLGWVKDQVAAFNVSNGTSIVAP